MNHLNHHNILTFIFAELAGSEREDVLKALAAAYVAAYDSEVDEDEHAERDEAMLNYCRAEMR